MTVQIAEPTLTPTDAGEIDAFDADRPGHTCTPNPYKEAS